MLPGLVIESEYCPAREVGGDFFQIIPQQDRRQPADRGRRRDRQGPEGGDAGGAAGGGDPHSGQIEYRSRWPAYTLNQRLMGRSDAQATCLALRIESDGA